MEHIYTLDDILTYCKVQYRVTKCVRMVHRVQLHLHIHLGPISVCNLAIPIEIYFIIDTIYDTQRMLVIYVGTTNVLRAWKLWIYPHIEMLQIKMCAKALISTFWIYNAIWELRLKMEYLLFNDNDDDDDE